MTTRKTRITNATIKSLKAGEAEYKVRDTEQRGFHIKVSPTGHKTYEVEARLGGTGKLKKYKICNVDDCDLPEVREQARLALNKIRSGIDPLLEKRAQTHEGRTLEELIQQYFVARNNLKQRTIDDYTYLKDKRFRPWLKMRVKDVTRHDVFSWYLHGRTKTPTQTEQAFRFLNSLMNFARALEIIKDNPCDLVTTSRIRYSVKRRTGHIELNNDLSKFLSTFIEYKFYRDSQQVARDIILLLLTTGLRVNEARPLKWSEVDMERRRFTILDPKNRRDHVVPMTPLTYAMFRHRQKNSLGSEYVFRLKTEAKASYAGNFQKTLDNICVQAKVPRVTPHDLRRTFSTTLNSIDIGYADLKFLMNHKDRDVTTAHYIQPDIERLRRHLCRVVDFYDRKIPYFEKAKGISQFTTGVLRLHLYGVGDVTPEELDNPTDEDLNWQAFDDRLAWED